MRIDVVITCRFCNNFPYINNKNPIVIITNVLADLRMICDYSNRLYSLLFKGKRLNPAVVSFQALYLYFPEPR